MKAKAILDQSEIRDAIREYVEKKTKGKVVQNGVKVRIHTFPGNDPREQDYVGAEVEYDVVQP